MKNSSSLLRGTAQWTAYSVRSSIVDYRLEITRAKTNKQTMKGRSILALHYIKESWEEWCQDWEYVRWMGLEKALRSSVSSLVKLRSHKKGQAPTHCALLDVLGEELILVMLEMKQKTDTAMEQLRVFHTTLRLIKLFFLTQVFKRLLVLIILFLVLDHRKSKSSIKTSTSVLLTMPKPLTVFITTNCGKFLKRWWLQPWN